MLIAIRKKKQKKTTIKSKPVKTSQENEVWRDGQKNSNLSSYFFQKIHIANFGKQKLEKH